MTDQEMNDQHMRDLEEEVAQFMRASSSRCTCRESETLRDKFARSAVIGLQCDHMVVNRLAAIAVSFGDKNTENTLARMAYDLADAMLEARKFEGKT